MTLNKKWYWILVIFFMMGTGVKKAQAQRSENQERPNIIYIMADDHTAQAIGAYNGRFAKLNPTPNIDKLADQGMRFDNTFVTNSICTPSRATIVSGQYSETNGVLILGQPLPKEHQYLPIELDKLGYNTAIIGKWHLKREPVFDYYEIPNGQGPYFDPSMHVKGKGQWPKNVESFKGPTTDVLTDHAMKWLSDRKQKQEPFYLGLHFHAPHAPWTAAKRYKDYLKGVELPEPPSLYVYQKEGVEGQKKKYSFKNYGSVATRGKNDSLVHVIGSSIGRRNKYRSVNNWIHLKVDPDASDREYKHLVYQQFAKQYLQCVKQIDDNVGRLVSYLKKNDLWDNTIIIYTSDQGEMLGSHDFMDKRWMYEESMQMPLIFRYPKMIKEGSVSKALINNTDFAPTILELAGGSVPGYMQGRSFKSILATGNEPKNWRTATYYRYWMHMVHHGVPAHFGLRTKKYKLIFFYGKSYNNQGGWGGKHVQQTPAAWEFYDLSSDPHEMDNRYNDPRYQKIIARLKKKLISLRKKYNETDEQYPAIQKIIDEHWDD